MYHDINSKYRRDARYFINSAEQAGCEELHIKFDKATGLTAIIAIHSTTRGPALGGVRLFDYPSWNEAVEDAIRLARGMTYKAAINQLDLGGGKAVLIKPKLIQDRPALFRAFGRFVEELNGKYIAAMDVGTSETDMDAIAEETSYVASTSSVNGDPSPFTAIGLREGILAAVEFKLAKHSLEGLHIALQGLGHCGYSLISELQGLGAKITGSDINDEAIKKVKNEFNIDIVSSEEIHTLDCDIFSPCAIGAVLNNETIPDIKASIIAGSANNQLALDRNGIELHEKSVLYAPDYVINSGGLIYATGRYQGKNKEDSLEHIQHIPRTLKKIFERSVSEKKATSTIADEMAMQLNTSHGEQ